MPTLVSFATPEYQEAQARMHASAGQWFDDHLALNPSHLSRAFIDSHSELLSYRRGYGFWCWKPLVIKAALHGLGMMDFVVYADSQIEFIADPSPLFEECTSAGGVLLFDQRREGHRNKTWTRRRCLEAMGADTEEYREGVQLNAAISVWSGTALARSVLREWQHWCDQLDVVGDGKPGDIERPEFRAHRHDQSILSLIAIGRKLKTLPDPSQFGDGEPEQIRVVTHNRTVNRPYPIPCQQPG